VPFESLVKPETDNTNQQDFEHLETLIGQGLSQNKAAEQLGMSKARASRLMVKFKGVSQVFQSETVGGTVNEVEAETDKTTLF
jgi:predicted transcriptional regulator